MSILIREGDAKLRHSEILMVAAVTRSKLDHAVVVWPDRDHVPSRDDEIQQFFAAYDFNSAPVFASVTMNFS